MYTSEAVFKSAIALSRVTLPVSTSVLAESSACCNKVTGRPALAAVSSAVCAAARAYAKPS